MAPEILVPNAVKAATAASATSAAATAYSDSSSPVSSFQNLLITVHPSDEIFVVSKQIGQAPQRTCGAYLKVGLLNLVAQVGDGTGDLSTQCCERGNGCERDERCGDGVF